MMSMFLTFNMARLKSFINNTPYKAEIIDYNYLNSRVDDILNPKPPAITSKATKESVRVFWKAFESSYTGDKTQISLLLKLKQDDKQPLEELLSF